jgi:hypothetical protein
VKVEIKVIFFLCQRAAKITSNPFQLGKRCRGSVSEPSEGTELLTVANLRPVTFRKVRKQTPRV